VPRDIGIDLGQTNTRVAWLGGAEGPQIPSNSDNERSTPTLVAVHAAGQFLAGRGALGVAAASPERAALDLVARLAGGGLVTLEGKSYRPESLVAFFLRKLKSDAEARLNDTVSRAFVAVPPTWNAAARKRLCDAGAEAGLTILPVESSLAAALAAGFRQPSDRPRYVLVYDLGGTNFSVAVLALEGASLRIRKTATLVGVGGAAFDQFLVDYVAVLVEQQHQVDPRLHGRFMTELYKQAEQAKILLGAHRSTDVSIAGMLRSESGSPLDVEVEIEREEFERMLEDQVRSTLLATLNVLGEAGVPVEELEAVILIGGSTSIPAVRSAVQSLVGAKKVVENVDPMESVALGAAWMSGQLAVQPQPADPASVVAVTAGPQPAVSQPAPTPQPVPAPAPQPPPQPAPQPALAPQPPPQPAPQPPPAAPAPAPEPAKPAPPQEAKPAPAQPPAPQPALAPQPPPQPAPQPPPAVGPAAQVLVLRWLLIAVGLVAVLYVGYFVWQLRPPEYTHVPLRPSEAILLREVRTFEQELPGRVCEMVREARLDGALTVSERLGALNRVMAEHATLSALFKRNSNAPDPLDLQREEVLRMIDRCAAPAR
jgi:actin-like ATPase involved in cell morphogenesis